MGTLNGLFHYRNADSTSDLNARFGALSQKGVVDDSLAHTGVTTQLVIPYSTTLTVEVLGFTAIGADGMAFQHLVPPSTILNVRASLPQYVLAKSIYRGSGAADLSFVVLSSPDWEAVTDKSQYIILAKVTPGASGPVLNTQIDLRENDILDKQYRSPWRGVVDTYANLPLDVGAAKVRDGDFYFVTDVHNLYRWKSLTTSWIAVGDGALSGSVALHKGVNYKDGGGADNVENGGPAISRDAQDWPAHPAKAVKYTAGGTVAADNVQDAIAEVASEKVAKAGDTMTGPLNINTTSGSALVVQATTGTAATVEATGAGTQTAIVGTGHGNGIGVWGRAQQTGAYSAVGVSGSGGPPDGIGVEGTGGSTSGVGVKGTGFGSGTGGQFWGGGSDGGGVAAYGAGALAIGVIAHGGTHMAAPTNAGQGVVAYGTPAGTGGVGVEAYGTGIWAGVHGVGGQSSAAGVYGEGWTGANGTGVIGIGKGSGNGVLGIGGLTGHGVNGETANGVNGVDGGLDLPTAGAAGGNGATVFAGRFRGGYGGSGGNSTGALHPDGANGGAGGAGVRVYGGYGGSGGAKTGAGTNGTGGDGGVGLQVSGGIGGDSNDSAHPGAGGIGLIVSGGVGGDSGSGQQGVALQVDGEHRWVDGGTVFYSTSGTSLRIDQDQPRRLNFVTSHVNTGTAVTLATTPATGHYSTSPDDDFTIVTIHNVGMYRVCYDVVVSSDSDALRRVIASGATAGSKVTGTMRLINDVLTLHKEFFMKIVSVPYAFSVTVTTTGADATLIEELSVSGIPYTSTFSCERIPNS